MLKYVLVVVLAMATVGLASSIDSRGSGANSVDITPTTVTASGAIISGGLVTGAQFKNSPTDGCYFGNSGTHGYCFETSGQTLVFRNNSAEQWRISGITGDFTSSQARNITTTGTGSFGGLAISASGGRITWTSAGRYIDVDEATGRLRFNSLGLAFSSKTLDDPTAPTLTGGCTSPSVTWNNGTALFQFDVGTSCAGISTISIVLPAATDGWECKCTNTTAAATRAIDSTAWSTTGITITNYSRTLGTAADFADGADIRCMCRGG